jgi:hypothetical protein
MIPAIAKEWTFTTAQTDFAIETVSATQRALIYSGVATCSNSNTGNVSLRCGTAAATLPTVTNNSATGNVGVPISHPGIAPGGGMVWPGGSEPIHVGADGEDVRITCSAATGGALVLVLAIYIEDRTPLA